MSVCANVKTRLILLPYISSLWLIFTVCDSTTVFKLILTEFYVEKLLLLLCDPEKLQCV